jgi:hypothetical protein
MPILPKNNDWGHWSALPSNNQRNRSLYSLAHNTDMEYIIAVKCSVTETWLIKILNLLKAKIDEEIYGTNMGDEKL